MEIDDPDENSASLLSDLNESVHRDNVDISNSQEDLFASQQNFFTETQSEADTFLESSGLQPLTPSVTIPILQFSQDLPPRSPRLTVTSGSNQTSPWKRKRTSDEDLFYSSAGIRSITKQPRVDSSAVVNIKSVEEERGMLSYDLLTRKDIEVSPKKGLAGSVPPLPPSASSTSAAHSLLFSDLNEVTHHSGSRDQLLPGKPPQEDDADSDIEIIEPHSRLNPYTKRAPFTPPSSGIEGSVEPPSSEEFSLRYYTQTVSQPMDGQSFWREALFPEIEDQGEAGLLPMSVDDLTCRDTVSSSSDDGILPLARHQVDIADASVHTAGTVQDVGSNDTIRATELEEMCNPDVCVNKPIMRSLLTDAIQLDMNVVGEEKSEEEFRIEENNTADSFLVGMENEEEQDKREKNHPLELPFVATPSLGTVDAEESESLFHATSCKAEAQITKEKQQKATDSYLLQREESSLDDSLSSIEGPHSLPVVSSQGDSNGTVSTTSNECRSATATEESNVVHSALSVHDSSPRKRGGLKAKSNVNKSFLRFSNPRSDSDNEPLSSCLQPRKKQARQKAGSKVLYCKEGQVLSSHKFVIDMAEIGEANSTVKIKDMTIDGAQKISTPNTTNGVSQHFSASESSELNSTMEMVTSTPEFMDFGTKPPWGNAITEQELVQLGWVCMADGSLGQHGFQKIFANPMVPTVAAALLSAEDGVTSLYQLQSRYRWPHSSSSDSNRRISDVSFVSKISEASLGYVADKSSSSGSSYRRVSSVTHATSFSPQPEESEVEIIAEDMEKVIPTMRKREFVIPRDRWHTQLKPRKGVNLLLGGDVSPALSKSNIETVHIDNMMVNTHDENLEVSHSLDHQMLDDSVTEVLPEPLIIIGMPDASLPTASQHTVVAASVVQPEVTALSDVQLADAVLSKIDVSIKNVLESYPMSEEEFRMFMCADEATTAAMVEELQQQQVLTRVRTIVLTPGMLVFARYNDKNYYSAQLLDQSSHECWNVKFLLDEVKRSVREVHILPTDVLPSGQLCSVRNLEQIFCDPCIVRNHCHTKSMLLHIVETMREGIKYAAHSHLILDEKQASKFMQARLQYQSLVASPGREISLENIVPGKRSCRSSGKPGKSLENLDTSVASNTGTDSDEAGSSSRISKSNTTKCLRVAATTLSSVVETNEDIGSPVGTPRGRGRGRGRGHGGTPRTPKTPGTARGRGGRGSISKQGSIGRSNLFHVDSETEILPESREETPQAVSQGDPSNDIVFGPLPPDGSKIFQDFKIVITCGETSIHNRKNEDERGVIPPFNRAHLCRQILAGAGQVLEVFEQAQLEFHWSQSQANKNKVLLVSNTYCRTGKYISCLALGIPIVEAGWVASCCRQNKCLPWQQFLLPAGESVESGELVEQHSLESPNRILTGCKFFLASSENPKFGEYWLPLLGIAGAKIRRMPLNKRHKVNLNRIFDKTVTMVLADQSIPEAELQKASRQKVQVVSSEWLIQSLIMGRCLAHDAHPKYKYDSSVNETQIADFAD